MESTADAPDTFTCTGCHSEHPVTERSPGRQRCRPCVLAAQRERSARWRAENPDKVKAKARRDYESRRDVVLAQQRVRRAEKRDELAAYARSYYQANKRHLMELERIRKERDPEAFTERRRRYRAANPERVTADVARYHARRRGAAVFEPGVNWQSVAARDGLTCSYCAVTCDPTDGHHVLGRDGANRWVCGPTYPTLDHITPVSLGGDHTMSNATLACNRCNKRKGARAIR